MTISIVTVTTAANGKEQLDFAIAATSQIYCYAPIHFVSGGIQCREDAGAQRQLKHARNYYIKCGYQCNCGSHHCRTTNALSTSLAQKTESVQIRYVQQYFHWKP